jgi:hypothetical protein
MKLFAIYLWAAVALMAFAAAAPADATLHHGLRSARHMARVFAQPDAQVPAPCGPTGNASPCSPNQSAFMGFANNNRGATVNGGLVVQTAGKAAFDIPFSGSNPVSWTFCEQGVYDNNIPQGWTGNNQASTWAANCTNSACNASGNGGARSIQVSSPGAGISATQNNELLISGLTSGTGGTNLSQPSGFTAPHTGIILTPGKAYTVCVINYLTDSAFSGEMYIYAIDASGNNAPGSPSITANNIATGVQGFYRAPTTFALYSQATIGPLFMTFGTTTSSVTNTYEAGASGPFANILMASGVFPNTGGVPTFAALQALATGAEEPGAWMNANGLTPQALYRLNDAGAGAPWQDTSGLGQTALAAVNSAYPPVASSPITPPSALVINEIGEGQLFRVTPGLTGPTATGPVPVSGTYNPSVLAAGVKGIQCAVLKNGVPIGSGWTKMAASAGVFSGQVTGVTQGAGYTRSCRFANSRSYSFQGAYSVRVGLLVGIVGQSELAVMPVANTTPTAGVGSNLQAAGGPLSTVAMNLSDPSSGSSRYVTNLGTGHVGLVSIDANNSPGSNTTGSAFVPCGDGCLAFLNTLAAVSGMPVEAVWMAKDGNGAESFAFDNVAVQSAISGTGGQTTWTGQALSFTASSVIPNANAGSSFFGSVKEGSLRIFDSGGSLIASDAQATPFHLNTICTWTSGATSMTCNNTAGISGATGAVRVFSPTGPNSGSVTTVSGVSGLTVNLSQATNTTGTNVLIEFTNYGPLAGATVASGSANYTGDTFTATFSSPPSTPLTATWTNVEDTENATYVQHVPYVGYGTTGDRVNPSSGFITQTWSQVMSPLSMVLFSQCNANQAEVQSITGSGNTTGLASMNAKWDYFFGTLLPQLPGYDPATPIVSLGYQRVAQANALTIAGCVYFQQQYVTHAHPTLPAPIYWGGEYPDYATQSGGGFGPGPHPTFGPLGGARQGRRWGIAANYAQAGQNLPNPAIASSAFSGANNVNIDITFTMPSALSGASLATCGANLSGGLNTPPVGAINGGTNTCSVTTSSGSPSCQGFRVGLSNSVMYNSYGVDEGDATSSAFNAIMAATGVAGSSNTFTCTVTSATTVRLTNTGTWSWAGGVVFVSYGAEGPGGLAGAVTGISITPGSGYTPGTYSFTTSTSTCSKFPKVFVHVGSGGAIDDAFINTAAAQGALGTGCTNPQAVTLSGMGSGTGGAVTLTIGTLGSDLNDLGEFLYANDNSTAYGGQSFEPGLPARRCVVPFQVGVAITC